MSQLDIMAAPGEVRLGPIDLEVLTEGLVAIVREMRQTVFRTAHSPVIAEAQDFSCALFGPDGSMVAQGRDMPGHVIAMPASVAEILVDFGDDLASGDLYIVNDPYRGGSHLNDVTLISPLFVDGALFLFPCVRMHWADIGGMTPGSVSGQATDILQEGIRIPPVRIARRGLLDEQVLTVVFANVRLPEERRGDLDAAIAACRTAERRLDDFVARYGRARVKACVEENMARTERRLRHRIAELDDGTYSYEDYVDLYTDGYHDPVRVCCDLVIDGDQITADLRGSSPQVLAVVNTSHAMTAAGVFIAVKSVLDPDGPVNAGAFRPIEVRTEPGTVVHVAPPAPANAHSEVRKRVISCVMAALSQVAPTDVTADQFGTTLQNLIGGPAGLDGNPYLYYDYPPGGNGAFFGSDGPSAMNPLDLGDISTVQSAERLEMELPLVIEQCELRTDSGGAGRWRGGLGVCRTVRLLAPGGAYSVQTDRTIIPPYGLATAHPGAPTATYIRRDGRCLTFETPGKVAGFPMIGRDVLVIESAGGGGWGDPLERDPAAVAEDLRAGYIDRDASNAVYGVQVTPQYDVDLTATQERRNALRRSRSLVTIEVGDEPSFAGRRGRQRLVAVPPGWALGADLVVGEGWVIELHGVYPAPLRVWTRIDDRLPGGTVRLDAEAARLLGASQGSTCMARIVSLPLRSSSPRGPIEAPPSREGQSPE